MDIILVKDVEKLGKTGSVVKVKDGFARNFLFPQKLAILATSANVKKVEQIKKRILEQRQSEKEQALNFGNRLNGLSVTISVAVHDGDKLYGSIAAFDIVNALKQEGISEVDAEAVILDAPIKTLGVYEIKLKLHPEVIAAIKVWVVKR